MSAYNATSVTLYVYLVSVCLNTVVDALPLSGDIAAGR